MKQLNAVIVGGCGHVGLPLGIVLAHHNHRVTLYDADAARVAQVNAGKMPFMEEGAEALLRQLGNRLRATTDASCLAHADVVVTVVGTPVDEHLNPTVASFCRDLEPVIRAMRSGALLILRSTIYPGVTRIVFERIKALGRQLHLAYCPERIAEGRAIEELSRFPQIIAAFEPEAQRRAREFFAPIAKTTIDLEPLEAELAKLFTNSWRYLSFAIANQFYMLAQSHGLDFYRIHDAATRDYPRMRAFAGAGLTAGPCLLKDTLQLAAFCGPSFLLGHAAMLVNEGMPNFMMAQLRAAGFLKGCVAILGMAFKADSDDARESLSYKLRKLLQVEGYEVVCTDPFVAESSLVSLEEALNLANAFILGAPHSAYSKLEIPAGKLVIDVWGFWSERANARRHPQRLAASGSA
jgi:UDP-N-acetyl-D-mannosaminuronic acid dehydrogenase